MAKARKMTVAVGIFEHVERVPTWARRLVLDARRVVREETGRNPQLRHLSERARFRKEKIKERPHMSDYLEHNPVTGRRGTKKLT